MFLLFLLLLLAALLGGGTKVPRDAVLVLDPQGDVVEQLSGNAADRARARLAGEERDAAQGHGGRDPPGEGRQAHQVLLIDADGMAGAGLSKLQELRAVIQEFKQAGKKVVAAGDGFDHTQYYLASCADEIFMHQEGLLLLEGYSRFATFYKEGIDKLEIDWNVFRVGEYKSAVEPFLRNDMSPEAKEANRGFLEDLWASWLADVGAARKKKPEEVQYGIDHIVELLREASGQAATVAQKAGLVDTVGGRDVVEKRLVALTREDKDSHSYPRIGFRDYLKTGPRDRSRASGRGDAVAVIVARGRSSTGPSRPAASAATRPPRSCVGRAWTRRRKRWCCASTAGEAAPSPPRSSARSWRARAAGKPVVVSMGSVAASGGYWIATSSDEIWASPSTVTGSIGIFGMFPTFQKPLGKHLGVHVDGVGTTWLSGALRPDREMKPELKEAFQVVIQAGYEDFLKRVAEARNMDRDSVDHIARGRVWSGEDAKGIKLVDQLGGLDQAVASAAKRAKLGERYRIWYVEKEPTFKERLATSLLTWTADWVVAAVDQAPSGWSRRGCAPCARAEELALYNDPRGIYAACLCEVE